MLSDRRGFSLLAALLLGLTGCSQEMPAESFATTTVSGRVHIGARPVDGGWVEFLPVDGTVGVIRSAPLGPGGRFSARGVAVGDNVLRLVNSPIPLPPASPNPRIRFDQFTSPIRRDIQPSEPLDVDLLSERVRLARQGSGEPPRTR